jgi:hypothetical protein
MIPGLSPLIGFLGGILTVNVNISSSTTNVNLFTLCGSPTSPGIYNITINSGVIVGSTSTGTAAIVSGTFPTGSIVNLINNGSVYGKEGAGGTLGATGSAGGPAMSLSYDITITNGSGSIFGGGGGGGSGGTVSASGSTITGPGGAGQGYGNQAGPGGGSGGDTVGKSPNYSTAGVGGNGGTWGSAGATGTTGQQTDNMGEGGTYPIAGSAGGAGGNSITKNGKTVTWISGNNSTHVKGAQV